MCHNSATLYEACETPKLIVEHSNLIFYVVELVTCVCKLMQYKPALKTG